MALNHELGAAEFRAHVHLIYFAKVTVRRPCDIVPPPIRMMTVSFPQALYPLYPLNIPLEYPGHFLVKRVTNAGTFRLKHKLLFIANALKQHHIGLEETDDGIWSIHFGTVLLAKVDEREMIIRD
ncbi:MAG TPA: hypothetical protein VGR09_05420 [Gemmatimonadales bacterium]|nr:hypothetical protein [Gemmatimonadales bacterium]